MTDNDQQNQTGKHSEPMFKLPMVMQVCMAIMLLLHIPQVIGLDSLANVIFSNLAFIPLRFQGVGYVMANPLASILSPIGYSFIHADWLHLLVNLGMLIAFGKVIITVCGNRVFAVLYIIGALAGSSVVLAVTQYPQYPLIGASSSVSAMVGAIACLGIMQRHKMPRPFNSRKRSFQFLLVWIGINILMAILPHAAFASSFAIAWQAHLAGLAAGYIYAHIGLRDYNLHTD